MDGQLQETSLICGIHSNRNKAMIQYFLVNLISCYQAFEALPQCQRKVLWITSHFSIVFLIIKSSRTFLKCTIAISCPLSTRSSPVRRSGTRLACWTLPPDKILFKTSQEIKESFQGAKLLKLAFELSAILPNDWPFFLTLP